MVKKGEKLTDLPRIGHDLQTKVQEIVRSGTCAPLRKLEGEIPPAVTELLKVPGLGPKRVRQARRGWLEKDHVLNSRTLKQLRPLLRRTMSRT